MEDLTPQTFALLKELVEEARWWNGTPMVCVNSQTRGNLTDLKRREFVETWIDDGIIWAEFLPKGLEFIEREMDPEIREYSDRYRK